MTFQSTLASMTLAAGIAIGVASPTIADEIIELGDYDLTQVEDLDRLQMDIVRSATDQCREKYLRFKLSGRHRRIDACIETAVDNAVAQVESWRLNRLHASIDAGDRYDIRRGPVSHRSASAE